MRDLTAQDVINYRQEMLDLKDKGFIKAQWCELGLRIKNTHGLTDRQVVNILHGDNVLEILAEKEGER